MNSLTKEVVGIYQTGSDLPLLAKQIGLIHPAASGGPELDRVIIRKAIDQGRLHELATAAQQQNSLVR